MNTKQLWTEEEKELLVKLWRLKYTAKYIGDRLNRKPQAIRQFVSRNKEELGLRNRDFKNWKNVKDKLKPERFDEEWHGIIPRGHWMITKPWGKGHV